MIFNFASYSLFFRLLVQIFILFSHSLFKVLGKRYLKCKGEVSTSTAESTTNLSDPTTDVSDPASPKPDSVGVNVKYETH